MEFNSKRYNLYSWLRKSDFSKETTNFIMMGCYRNRFSGKPYSEKINREVKAAEMTFCRPKTVITLVKNYALEKREEISKEMKNWQPRNLIERVLFP